MLRHIQLFGVLNVSLRQFQGTAYCVTCVSAHGQ